MPYPLITAPNWQYWQDPGDYAPNGPAPIPNAGGFGDKFGRFRDKFGDGKALFGKFGIAPGALKGLGTDIRATNLFQGGPRLGQLGYLGMGAYQGINAAQGFAQNAQADTDYRSLIKDIKSSAYANPMASQYLTADQNRLLRQARTGGLDAGNWGGAAQGVVQGIPQALFSTLIGGITGGIPGAVLGGLGSLGNSAIQGYGDRTREQVDKLSSLYSALQNAEAAYRDESNRRIRSSHFNNMY
jgi:hypothetical protein